MGQRRDGTAVPARAGRTPISRREWASIAGTGGFVALLHVLGWGSLVWLVAPANFQLGDGRVLGIGVGVTAYVLGMRHAFDADHIAAIDNTTRKLMAEGRKPVSVGFWFALGHSSVVFGLCVLLGFGVRGLAGQVGSDASVLQSTTGVVGTVVSGVFLMLIAAVNLAVLVGIVRLIRRLRAGTFDEVALEDQLNNRGLLARLLRGLTRAVRRPWHMYPVGLLFGLGFDTATEVSLLVLAGGAAAFALPWYAILTLPVLFAAGMSLLDTIDGAVMRYAYGWSLVHPARKLYYNLTLTGLSIAVAAVIGGIELIGLLAEKLGVRSGPLAAIGSVDLEHAGYAVAALFVATWLVAVAVWHLAGIERRWSPAVKSSDGSR
jgi:high-affinity nickel-transport protein